jgi:3-methyladenine DNA glycosylase AlkC
MAAGYSLKDDLFNRETVSRLANEFDDAGVFKAQPFIDQVMAGLLPLELKARIAWIALVLADHLPADFPAAAAAIHAALPPPLDPALTDDDFGHFIHAPLGVYVENHGLAGHLATSLDLLEAITKRFSMEFSIRAFLNTHEGAVLDRMQDWAVHPNYHVRRLVSEGTRPKLPWGKGVGLTHDQTLPLLDTLHNDPTRYVVRSVANHLNDIAKSKPDIVIDRLQEWQSAAQQTPNEIVWMFKHATRTLIKTGHPGAMALLGYAPHAPVSVQEFAITPIALNIGDAAEVTCTLIAPENTPVIVDYVIDYVKANGRTAPKVSKFKVLGLKANQPVDLSKKHTFRGDATTFKLYSGAHQVHLQVNGRILASLPFTLN